MDAEEARASAYTRLSERRSEIEQAILSRLMGVPDRASGRQGAPRLSIAVSAGVGHGLAGVAHGADRAGPIPDALFVAAHRAARRGTDLPDLLSGYFESYALFCDFILQAADEEAARRGRWLREVLRVEAVLFERVLAAIAAEHTQERRRQSRPPAARQLECVNRLLAGKFADPAELSYEIDGWHLGAIARGGEPAPALRDLARRSESRLLLVSPDSGTAWAWFGGRGKGTIASLARNASSGDAAGTAIALGEPARGMLGWRLTHRQASTALRFAPSDRCGLVRYADVGLMASVAQDELLVRSLRQMYLVPLSETRDGGADLRETLRAYFAANGNASSAAAALGVSRQTVSGRLRMTEELIGRPLEVCVPELEVALKLADVPDAQ